MKGEKRYRRGGPILSLDELARQKRIYWKRKPCLAHNFGKWSLRFLADAIEKRLIYYSIEMPTGGRRLQEGVA